MGDVAIRFAARAVAALTLAAIMAGIAAIAGCGAQSSLTLDTRATQSGGALLRGHSRRAPHQVYILELDGQTFWPSGGRAERVVVSARVDEGEHCVVFASCPHQLSSAFEECRPHPVVSPRMCFVAEPGRTYLLDREIETRYVQREAHHWFTVRELGTNRYVGGFGHFVQGGPAPSATAEQIEPPADWRDRTTDHRKAGAGVKNSS